jgi:hypothetical protein
VKDCGGRGKTEGLIVGGGKRGLTVRAKEDISAESTLPWSEFGAGATVRLGERLLNLTDGSRLEQLAMCATVVEDYITAHRLFERLMRTAPERLAGAAGYFERAETGYANTVEGGAEIGLERAKKLVRARDFRGAMKLLTELQKDLAKNSALRGLLKEVYAYRRSTQRRFRVNDDGDPMSEFEKKVQKVFGGDARLEEDTGDIEVTYDFSDRQQLKDWVVVHQFGQPALKAGWTVASGLARCMGKDRILMWKFPISDFDIEADLTYEDEVSNVFIYMYLTKKFPRSFYFTCRNGRARLVERHHLSWMYWYSGSTHIWRPGETATLRFTHDRDAPYPFALTVNGEYAVSGSVHPPRAGTFGLSFGGGAGTVDNVVVRGRLDIDWFKRATAGIRG